MRYHQTCSTISIYAFDKISETKDLRFMVVGWDEFKEIKIDEEIAQKYWEDIFNEYIVLSDDNKITMYYEALQELSNLKTRKHVVTIILDRILTIKDNAIIEKYIEILGTLKFKVNKTKPLKDEVERLTIQLKGADNKIRLTEDKLKNLQSDEKPIPLMKQVIRMEQALGKNLIDPKITTVEKWLFMYEEAKSKNQKAA